VRQVRGEADAPFRALLDADSAGFLARDPGLRAGFALQAENAAWRIRHVHFSFDPNAQKQDQKA
jgi:hypothetical protein